MNITDYTKQAILPEDARINTYNVRVKLAQLTFMAVQQGLICKNGKGLSTNIVAEDDVRKLARVMAIRVLPHNVNPRVIGDSKVNGGYGDDRKAYIPATETVYIDLLNYFDRELVIPEIQENLIDKDVLALELANYETQIALDINGGTLAKRLEKSYFNFADKKVIEYDVGNEKVALPIGRAITQTMKGDAQHGFGFFKSSGMIGLITLDTYNDLLSDGVIVSGQLGAYNEKAQSMIANGVISPDANLHFEEDGFVGQYRNIDFHAISDSVLAKAEEYLGLCGGELVANGFYGCICASETTSRGLGSLKDMKVLDYQDYRGKLVQPLINYGVEVFFPKGNTFIFKKTGVIDIVSEMKSIWGDYAIKCKAFGSRVALSGNVSAITTSAFTGNVSALVNNLSGEVFDTIAFVQADAPISNVVDFFVAYKTTGAKKGTATSGVSKTSLSLTSNKYITCLGVAKDGTCVLFSEKVPA